MCRQGLGPGNVAVRHASVRECHQSTARMPPEGSALVGCSDGEYRAAKAHQRIVEAPASVRP